jgi:TatD DNase family protein
MFVDSHCHLSFPELSSQLPEIRAAMAQAQVDRALCICTTLEEFEDVHALALGYDNFWASVGVHPDNEGVTEPSIDNLLERAALPRVVAIGETGLDYYQMDERKGGRTWPTWSGSASASAAHPGGPPMRQAADHPHPRGVGRHLAILKEEGEDGSPGSAGGVFHCFTETAEVARGRPGPGLPHLVLGHPDLQERRRPARGGEVRPADRLLIETDSPYLAPVPFRGKTNNPSYVPYVAQQIAEVRKVPVEAVGELTSRNFERAVRAS